MPPITNPEILPGVTTIISDKQLRVAPTQTGPKVTVLGFTTSVALDEGEPVLITDPTADLRRLRHIDDSPSELSLAVAELLRVGAPVIEVVKIGTTGLSGPAPTPNVRFDSLEASYENLKYHDVDYIVPIGAYVDQTGLSGSSPLGQTRSIGFHRQLGNFCYQATKLWNSCYGFIGVRPLNQVAFDEDWDGAPADATEILFNDPPIAHVREWIKHLRAEAGDLVDHSAETVLDGYLAGSEETSPGQISGSYDLWAEEENGDPAVDRYGESVDGGAYFAVTAFLARIRTQETQNLANINNVPDETSQHCLSAGAVAYAGLIARIPPEIGATNQPIQGLVPSRKMASALAVQLIQARMVTMCDRSGSFVVSKDVSAAHNGGEHTKSDFTLTSTMRIVHAMTDIVRNRSLRFLGKPIVPTNTAALSAEIRAGLESMQPSGAIRSFDFFIRSTPDQQVLGKAVIEVQAQVGMELTDVTNYIGLQKPEGI
jgi:hypothetical protein